VICSRCGVDREIESGRSICPKCLKYMRAYNKKVYDRNHQNRKTLGLCCNSFCKSISIEGGSYCGYHAELRADSQKRIADKRRDSGRCITCGRNKAPEGFSRCEPCRIRARNAYHNKQRIRSEHGESMTILPMEQKRIQTRREYGTMQ